LFPGIIVMHTQMNLMYVIFISFHKTGSTEQRTVKISIIDE